MPTITDEMVNIFILIGVNMKLKRIIAALFATTLLLAPVSASEARLPICSYCMKPSVTYIDCGGIDDSQTQNIHCEEHGKTSQGAYICTLTERYGYTNFVCVNCGEHNYGRHYCQYEHSIDEISHDVCPYGSYPH